MLWNQKQHDTVIPCESRDTEQGGINRLAVLSSISPMHSLDEEAGAQPFRINETFGCKDFRSLNYATADCRHVVSVGRFLVTNAIRQILGRQVGGPRWSIQDVQHFQSMIEQMTVQVRGRISKLVESDVDFENVENAEAMTTEGSEGSGRQSSVDAWGLRASPQSHIFIAWSKKLLALMIEKAHCTLYQPLQSYSDKKLWWHFRDMQVLRSFEISGSTC
jgi:hypothetical protein